MRHLSAGNTSVLAAPANPELRYYGYTVRETAGQPASIIIHNSADNTGAALATINLAANESRNEWLAAGGTLAASGIFVERVSGNAQIAVFFRS